MTTSVTLFCSIIKLKEMAFTTYCHWRRKLGTGDKASQQGEATFFLAETNNIPYNYVSWKI